MHWGRRWANARVAPTEFSLTLLPEEVRAQLVKTAGRCGAVVTDASELTAALEALRPGRPLAPWLWVAFGVLMCVELLWLAWRGRGE